MEKHKTLMVMVGIPGAGKSTWIQNHKFHLQDFIIVSRDKIRFSMLKDGEDYFSHENEVWETFIAEIKKNLEEGGRVIVDATHINIASRTKLLKALGNTLKNTFIEAIVLDTSLQTCLEHNELRKENLRAYVPKSQIRRMYASFTIPELEEGFDEIYIYDEDGGITLRR